MPPHSQSPNSYRWVVISVFMLINITIQILWITFGAITLPAAAYYAVNDAKIGMLSMIFMIVFIPLSLPVSWLIDKAGFRISVSIGAAVMGIFALLRGIWGESLSAVFWTTVGIAIAQPFILNAWTTAAARWFPVEERATAVGMLAVGNFIGTGIGLAVTPLMLESMSIQHILLVYGIIAAVSAVLFILFAKESPDQSTTAQPPEERALMLDGLKSMLKNRNFWILMFAFLVGNGIFNGLSTWIEAIVRPRGFDPEQAGLMGGLLLVGGIIGAAIIPALSDKTKRRKPFLIWASFAAILPLVGIIFLRSYTGLLASFAFYGFFAIAISPIGFQYAAEITYPAPEGTSNGLLFLVGQISVVFIYAMEALRGRSGTFTFSLLLLVGLSLLNVIFLSRAEESKITAPQPTASE
ncbi:MAG: MFS transporter [Anaerolineaceae bacterium]|nr:MFS transporter [Anaerolineaceae bacterium]